MPELKAKRRSCHSVRLLQIAALLSTSSILMLGCDKKTTTPKPTNTASPFPKHFVDTQTEAKPDSEETSYWRMLTGDSLSSANSPKDYGPDELFEAVIVDLGGPPEIGIPVVRAGVDPRFYLTLRLITVPALVPEWRIGDVIAFHIHSPSLLFDTFLGPPVVGLETRFAIARHPSEGIAFLEHAPERDAMQRD